MLLHIVKKVDNPELWTRDKDGIDALVDAIESETKILFACGERGVPKSIYSSVPRCKICLVKESSKLVAMVDYVYASIEGE